MFKLNTKIILFLLIAILMVVGLFFFVFKKDNSPSLNINKEIKNEYINKDNSGLTEEKKAEVKNTPISGSILPKYTGRPLSEVRFGKGFSAPDALIEKNKTNLNTLASLLLVKPIGDGGVDDWIALGGIKKFFNDYEGTRDVWEYAGVLYPNNALSFANLGSLYGFYLGDNIKAELNFKKALTNDPYQSTYYINLADFYKNVYIEKKSEAVSTLLQGMSVIKDINLVLSLATYYRDVGDKVNALKYYEEVLKIQPNTVGIQDEINRLK